MRVRALGGMLLVQVLAITTAAADDKPTVVLIVRDPEAPFSVRLRAELETMRFRVRIVAESQIERPLSEVAQAEDAQAAVRVLERDEGLSMMFRDARRESDEEHSVRATGTRSDPILAVQAVELIRARLVEIEAAHVRRAEAHSPSYPASSAAAINPPSRPETQAIVFSLRLEVGPILGRDATPAGALRVSPALRLSPHLAFDAAFDVSAIAAIVRRDQGRAALRPWSAGLGVRVDLLPPKSRFVLSLRGGGALVILRMDGSAQSPFAGRTSRIWSPMVELSATGAWRLTNRTQVSLGCAVMVATRKLSVRFDGQPVATWGLPVVLPSLGIERSF